MIKVLFFGDIVGRIGRDYFLQQFPELKKKYKPDLIIVNGENSANGKGITSKICSTYFNAGVTCITTGNHLFDNREIISNIDDFPALIRPLNYSPQVPGNTVFKTTINGISVAVVNLLGQVFMPPIDNPFVAMENLLQDELSDSQVIIADLHAEATSEKRAFGVNFAGRVSAVLGTHTHVQTADAEIIDGHTGYLTDVGMVGAKNSILGMGSEAIIRKFLTQMPERFAPPEADSQMQMDFVYLEISATGQTTKIVSEHLVNTV